MTARVNSFYSVFMLLITTHILDDRLPPYPIFPKHIAFPPPRGSVGHRKTSPSLERKAQPLSLARPPDTKREAPLPISNAHLLAAQRNT